MSLLYLDANATEPLRPAAREAALRALDLVGNPSSVHAAGRAARRILDQARRTVADLCGVPAGNVVFTSGGTEADALAIHALGRGRAVAVAATEHPAVLQAAPGAHRLAVDQSGVLDLPALQAWLAANSSALVCVMAANNETGVIQPLADIARICQAAGAWLHVDAVQAPGRVPLPAAGHSLALSGHKAGGPKGAGALVLRMAAPLPPLIAGGGQEHGHRGGTEALPAIAGMAAALAEAVPRPDQAAIRDAMEQAAVAAGAVPLAAGAPRLPNTTCLALPGRRADLQVIALDLAGVAVSAGAACSSGRVGPSHVLAAMGAAEWAAQAIRISLPWNLPDDAAPRFAHAYAAMAARMTHAA